MDFKIFKSKKLSADKTKLLLAQPTMLFRTLDPTEYQLVAKHIVKEDEVVRPDLIATEYYNSTSGLDIILKFNGISDPFSIMPGETIYIPMDTIPYYKLESPAMYEENPIKAQFIDTKRLSKTDQRRLEALKKKYNKEALLPPNVIPVGKKNYEFDGTNVRLGMGPQTDPVTATILNDIANDEMMPTKGTGISVIIDMADNAQVENTSPSTNEENLYGAIVGGAGASGAGASGAGAGASGAGAGASGAGAGASGAGDGKKDEADATGGNIPDGTGPASTNNNPTDSPDSPCSK
jgi:hypothetical protein